jgi:GAF domain-containing protein
VIRLEEEIKVNNPIEPNQPPNVTPAPFNPAVGPEYTFSRQRWLENFLKIILRASVIIGLILVGASFLTNTEPILLIIYAVAYAALLIAAFIKLPYRIRAGLFLFLIFSLGVSSLLENGIRSDSRTFFPVFIVMAAMLYGQRAVIYAIILTILAGIGIGIPLLTGHLALISAGVTPGTWDAWIMAYLVIILLAILLTTGLRKLQEEFDRAEQSTTQYQKLLTEERNGLDARVQERTEELSSISEITEKRARQLETIAEVARQISQVQDINELLPAISRLISKDLGFYHVGIFLLDEKKEYAVLKATSSSGGQQMLRRGHRIKIGQIGIVGYVAEHAEARISLDVGADANFFDNPDLPDTHSEMALPLNIGGQLIGILDVQSEKTSAFIQQDIDVMSTLANQVAIAIENARRFSETNQALAEERTVYGQYLRQAWQQSPLETKIAGYQYVNAQVKPLPESLDRPEINSAVNSGQMVVQKGENPALAVPLKIRGEVIGVLNISSNTSSRVWNENELAVVRAVADRVALALENARLFEETTRRADRERTVSEISTHIRSESDPESMLQTALDELKRALGAKDIQIRPYTHSPVDQNTRQQDGLKTQTPNPTEAG